MKKSYIVPSCKEFQVRPVEMIATSPSVEVTPDDPTKNWGNTKEEKTQGSGIWDLY